MKCSRGKFARLSNVKIDTLRYYEECGLINIDYNEETKSYEYTDREIFFLFMIKEMRSIGLTIDDVKQHFANPYKGMEYQLEYIDQKIEYYQALKEQIGNMQKAIMRRDDDIHEFERSEAYYFSFTKAAQANISKEEAAEWISSVPFAWANIIFECDLDNYEGEEIPVELALGIQSKYAKKYISNLDAPYITPSKSLPALYFNIRTKHFDKINYEQLVPVRKYAKAHGYHFTGKFGGIFKACEEDNEGNIEYIFGIMAEIEK